MASGDSTLFDATMLSLEISVLATAAVAVVGIPLAFVMERARFRGKWLLDALMLLPLVLPPTVVGYLLIVVFGVKGLVGKYLFQWWDIHFIFELKGAVLAAAVMAFPLLYMPARAAFAGVGREVEDSAEVLGASWVQMFFRVSVPEALGGLAAGVVLAFARALGEFGATLMVYGYQPGHLTLPISIWESFDQNDMSGAWPAVTAMSVLSLVLILIYNRAVKRRRERQ